MRRLHPSAAVVASLLAACGADGPIAPADAPVLETAILPIEAICQAQVDGSGMVDVETDYIPHVVACENGGADFAALQAQAVAARSFLYYKIRRQGRIGDGQQDQVYTCGRGPGQEHRDAAATTAGQILMYHDDVIAAFYVAGAIPSTQDCRPAAGDRDPTNTEHWVTYNEGNAGNEVVQTELGWVDPGNWANRGCKSQNGANCLSQHGRPYDQILRFYYGEDIGLVTADGPCAGEPPPPPPPPPSCEARVAGGETVIDEGDPCFEKACRGGDFWYDVNTGHGGHAFMTYADDTPAPACDGRWRFSVDAPGEYEVSVYLEDYGPPLSRQAVYTVRHDGVEDRFSLDMEGQHGWVVLGTMRFGAGGPQDQWVYLPDNTGEPYVDDDGPRLLYDAIRLRPPPAPSLDAAAPPPPPPPPPGPDAGHAAPPGADAYAPTHTDMGDDPAPPTAPPRSLWPDSGAAADAGPGAGGVPPPAAQDDELGARGSSFQGGGCRQAPGALPLLVPLLFRIRRPRRR